jgi:hypothetical protein
VTVADGEAEEEEEHRNAITQLHEISPNVPTSRNVPFGRLLFAQSYERAGA